MDQVRTQQQTIRTDYRPRTNNPINHLIKIYRAGGLRGMYLGTGAVLVGCGPAHALQVGLSSFSRTFCRSLVLVQYYGRGKKLYRRE